MERERSRAWEDDPIAILVAATAVVVSVAWIPREKDRRMGKGDVRNPLRTEFNSLVEDDFFAAPLAVLFLSALWVDADIDLDNDGDVLIVP